MKQVIALGFFDGVHLAHGRLLEKTRQLADELGCGAAALTFDRSPGKNGGLLTTVPERERLMRERYGMDTVLCAAFTESFRNMPWQEFLTEFLIRQNHAAALVCGWDFRCGRGGEGTASLLSGAAASLGVPTEILPCMEIDGTVVSAAHIRGLLQSGDAETASRFLGRPYRLCGTVEHGKAFGRTMGTPTANLRTEPGLLLPGNGVYAVRGNPGGGETYGVCNIGTRPTVDGAGVTVEVWFPEFSGELYGQSLCLDFCRRLRGEQRFSSPEELRVQILSDAETARLYFE